MSIVCELLSCIRAIYIGLHMLIRSSSSHPDTSILCFDCFSYSVSPHFTSHENLLQRLAQPHCTCSCLTPFHSVLPLECCEQYSIYVDICLFIECEIAKYIRFIFFRSMHTLMRVCVSCSSFSTLFYFIDYINWELIQCEVQQYLFAFSCSHAHSTLNLYNFLFTFQTSIGNWGNTFFCLSSATTKSMKFWTKDANAVYNLSHIYNNCI